MASTFRVKETFPLRSRAMLMVVGEIVEGVVRIGDRATVLGVDLSVAAIEMLTH